MLDTVPNRNWPEFYSTLMSLGHAHLEPASLASFVEAESLAGSEAFYSADVFEIINFGLEGSVDADVQRALDAWRDEVVKVLVTDIQCQPELAQTLRLVDRDAFAACLVESLALPDVNFQDRMRQCAWLKSGRTH